MILLAAVDGKAFDPRLYDDRVSSPDNVYQRVAQHQETLRVVSEYPSLEWDLAYTTMSPPRIHDIW